MREYIPLPPRNDVYVLEQGGVLRHRESGLEEPGPGDLLFRLVAAGLQPEDLSPRFLGLTPTASAVAEIAAVGDGVRGWSPLDRAVLARHLPTGDPVPAVAAFIPVAGRYRQEAALKLPVEIPADEATMLPAAALAARCLREARVPRGGSLLVLGLGLVGQITLLLARHQGVQQIFAADASPTLQKKAEYNGASRVVRVGEESVRDVLVQETGARGVNAVVLFGGHPTWMQEGVQSLAHGGTVVFGIPLTLSIQISLASVHIQSREIRVQGVRAFAPRDVKTALKAMSQGNVNGESLISRRIAWGELDGETLAPGYWEHGTHVVVEGP
jgi:threonine dehydrogenase-like Zn-dependent dehydrogenase